MAIMTVLSIAKIPSTFFLLIIALLSLSLGGSLLIGESVQASSLKLQALSTGAAIGTLSFVIFHEIIGKTINHFRNLHVWLLISLGVLIIYVYQYSLSLLHGH
jgi:ZIP family zinc transporter